MLSGIVYIDGSGKGDRRGPHTRRAGWAALTLTAAGGPAFTLYGAVTDEQEPGSGSSQRRGKP